MSPQSLLFDFERGDLEDLDGLTDVERAVYTAVEYEDTGVREFARQTDRRAGTVGNLLKRARLRLDDRDQEVADTWFSFGPSCLDHLHRSYQYFYLSGDGCIHGFREDDAHRKMIVHNSCN